MINRSYERLRSTVTSVVKYWVGPRMNNFGKIISDRYSDSQKRTFTPFKKKLKNLELSITEPLKRKQTFDSTSNKKVTMLTVTETD